MRMRPASPDEGWRLRELEIASKAYWGYPNELMERFSRLISMTPDYVRKHEVWVLEDAEEVTQSPPSASMTTRSRSTLPGSCAEQRLCD